jgi:hypothetical protein
VRVTDKVARWLDLEQGWPVWSFFVEQAARRIEEQEAEIASLRALLVKPGADVAAEDPAGPG